MGRTLGIKAKYLQNDQDEYTFQTRVYDWPSDLSNSAKHPCLCAPLVQAVHFFYAHSSLIFSGSEDVF